MVERSIAWIVTNGHRRVHYRGVDTNRAQLALRVAAINLRRLINLGLNHNAGAWAVTQPQPPDRNVDTIPEPDRAEPNPHTPTITQTAPTTRIDQQPPSGTCGMSLSSRGSGTVNRS